MLHLLVTACAFVLLIQVSVVNAVSRAKSCHDHTPSKVKDVKITGYPDPWSLSLSWTAPSQCVSYYYVFVRNGGILPQGIKDFKPDQVIKTKETHLSVYSLKSNWKYRLDVVAVNSRYVLSSKQLPTVIECTTPWDTSPPAGASSSSVHEPRSRRGRSGYATVFGTTPKDLRYSTPSALPAAKTPSASKAPSPQVRPPPLPSVNKLPGHGTTSNNKAHNKKQQQPTLSDSSAVSQNSSTNSPKPWSGPAAQHSSTNSPKPWSGPAAQSPSQSPTPAAAPSPAASPPQFAAQQSPAPTVSECDPSKVLGGPVNIAAVFVGDGRDKVRVTWTPPVMQSCSSVLAGYKLTGVDGFGATILNTPLKTSERDVTVTRLNFATAYTFKLVALSMQGEGAAATIAVNPSTGSVIVTGSAAAVLHSSPAAVASSPAAAPPSAAQGTTSPVPSTSSPLPQPAATQQVQGSNSASGTHNSVGCQGDAKPAAPHKFTAVASGTNMIKLQWSHGDRSVCTDSFKLDGYVLKTGDPIVTTLTGYTSYILTKLDPGTQYAFTVAAVNAKGRGRPATAFVSTPKEGR